MTSLQFALLAGTLIGVGVAGLVYQLVPPQPALADVLSRLSPPARRRPGSPTPTTSTPSVQERLGIWAQRTLPARLLGLPPARDLAVLRMTPAQFYGKKVTYALLGLVLPAFVGAVLRLIGIPIPTVFPLAATLGLGAVMFMAPARDVAVSAKAARTEFARAVSAYIELCALERNSGAGASVALSNAAGVGESWVFRRISEELARSRYDGRPPWDALTGLAEELAIPELADVADIMRIASDESAEVYRQLRARSASLRSALLSAELAKANVVEERMYVPGAFIGIVFLALLLTPPLLRLIAA